MTTICVDGICDPPNDPGCTVPGSACIYCNTSLTDPAYACTPEEQYPNLGRCRLFGGINHTPLSGPSYSVQLAAGQGDIFGNRRIGNWSYIVDPAPTLMVDPCGTSDDSVNSKWLCRAFIFGDSQGWRMWCHEYATCEDNPQSCDQCGRKAIPIQFSNTSRHVFVHLTAVGRGSINPECFEVLNDIFCYSSGCTQGENVLWGCVGSMAGDILNFIEVDFGVIGYSADATRYPMGNPHESVLKGLLLRQAVRAFDRTEAGGAGERLGHDADTNYDAALKSTWTGFHEFDQEPVRGTGDGYGEYDGQPIPITCRSRITDVEFEAELVLDRVDVQARLHTENRSRPLSDPTRPPQVRMMGDIFVTVDARVRLKNNANDIQWPFSFLNPTDPFDLRVEDPDNLGSEHPHEIVTAFGPNGERVARRASWRGLRSHRRYSRVEVDVTEIGGTHPFTRYGDTPAWYGVTNLGCCNTYDRIAASIIHAEINDGSEIQPRDETGVRSVAPVNKPQRYVGSCGFTLPALDDPNSVC